MAWLAKLGTVPNPVDIPEPLRLRYRQTVQGRAWLSRLPGFIRKAFSQWELTADFPAGAQAWHGHTAVVIPVRRSSGEPAALKVAFPHDEALLEPTALTLWDGRGSVRLLDSDPTIGAMLLERLDDQRSLTTVPMDEAATIWGGVVKALGIVPDDRPEWAAVPHIAGTAERYSDELPQRWTDLSEPFPRWLLEAALEVCQTRGAVGRRSSNDVLVHTDLHFENILARPDGSHYLAIDPQVQIGDAEFAIAPCLWNRLQDLPTIDAEGALRRRASTFAREAGLHGELSAQWSVLREVENALCYLEEPGRADDARRSLWVASTMAGKTMPGLPDAHQLKRLG